MGNDINNLQSQINALKLKKCCSEIVISNIPLVGIASDPSVKFGIDKFTGIEYFVDTNDTWQELGGANSLLNRFAVEDDIAEQPRQFNLNSNNLNIVSGDFLNQVNAATEFSIKPQSISYSSQSDSGNTYGKFNFGPNYGNIIANNKLTTFQSKFNALDSQLILTTSTVTDPHNNQLLMNKDNLYINSSNTALNYNNSLRLSGQVSLSQSTTTGLSIANFTKEAGAYTVVKSVNDVLADANGNVTIATGGGGSVASRFGVAGEDDTANENRLFNHTGGTLNFSTGDYINYVNATSELILSNGNLNFYAQNNGGDIYSQFQARDSDITLRSFNVTTGHSQSIETFGQSLSLTSSKNNNETSNVQLQESSIVLNSVHVANNTNEQISLGGGSGINVIQANADGVTNISVATFTKAVGNYTVPKSVNGVLADTNGNITIATGGGSTPDLQAVTNVGRQTTNGIIVTTNTQGPAFTTFSITGGFEGAEIGTSNIFDRTGGYLQLISSDLKASYLATHSTVPARINYLPDAEGTLAISVNNIAADATGNITIAVGGGDAFYIEVTKTQLDTAITNSTLIKGATYKVTSVHPTLYSDGVNTGTTIYVVALETNKISTNGVGEFYNPKYNTAVNDFGIWNNISYMTATAPLTGVLRPGEIITANNGATGTLVSGFSNNRIIFTVTSGDWTTATSATNTGGVSTNLSVPVIRSYAIGAKVIWGGYTWTNTTGLVGASTSIFALGADWTKVPYDIVDYNLVYDNIDYDYVNNIIIKRTDNLANTVDYEFADLAYLATKSIPGTPISCFQWGNRFSQRNRVHSGCIENINAMGEVMGNELYGQSIMTNNFMFHTTPLVEQNNMFIYQNILRSKSEMRNNVIVDNAAIYRNTLSIASTMNSNKIYFNCYIHDNILDVTCGMNSNEIRRALFVGNNLRAVSNINSNVSNQNAGHIQYNNLYRGGTISSNTINGIYVQSSASDRCFIFNNTVNTSNINNNIINIVPNGRTVQICANTLLGDNNQDIPIRVSQINGCTITGNGNTYIRMCQLKTSQINNAVIDNPANDFRYIDLEDYVWNFANVTSTGRLDGIKANSKSITGSFLVNFGGGAGTGAIGNLTIPSLEAPTGYFIEEVIIDVKTALVGVGAVLNLGIAVDNTQSGINDTTGDIATLNTAGITKIIHSTFTKATATRAILMEVKTAVITSGSIGITLRLSKL